MEQYPNPIAITWVGINYYSLIQVFLYKNSPEDAKKYLERFYQYLEKNKISKKIYSYRLAKARTLRSSSRVRERAEAEITLKDLIEGHEVAKSRVRDGIPDELTIALI